MQFFGVAWIEENIKVTPEHEGWNGDLADVLGEFRGLGSKVLEPIDDLASSTRVGLLVVINLGWVGLDRLRIFPISPPIPTSRRSSTKVTPATCIRGHSLVGELTQLADGRIASASFDGTVNIWDPNDVSAAPVVIAASGLGGLHQLADGRLVIAGFGVRVIELPDR